jgi:hypothetical protein
VRNSSAFRWIASIDGVLVAESFAVTLTGDGEIDTLPHMKTFLAVLVSLSWFASFLLAEDDASIGAGKYLLLQSGRILTGDITHMGSRYAVRQPGTELKVREQEVIAVCNTREECLTARTQQRHSGSVTSHLELAEWCIREKFFDAASKELAEVRLLDGQHERLTILQRRLEAAAAETSVRPSVAPTKVASGDELDRMMRNLPEGAAEQFATTIQPLLMNHCASAGCHGPSSPSDLKLLRAGQNSSDRRSAQRNLQTLLAYIDREHLMDSPLLVMPIQPHGTATSPVFTSRDAAQYKQLAIWVQRISGGTTSAESDLMVADAAKDALTGSRLVKSRTVRHATLGHSLANRPRKSQSESAVVPASAEEAIPASEER